MLFRRFTHHHSNFRNKIVELKKKSSIFVNPLPRYDDFFKAVRFEIVKSFRRGFELLSRCFPHSTEQCTSVAKQLINSYFPPKIIVKIIIQFFIQLKRTFLYMKRFFSYFYAAYSGRNNLFKKNFFFVLNKYLWTILIC